MSYLHIGQNVIIPDRRIIGVFDLDNTTTSKHTRAFLNGAQEEGVVVDVYDDIPRSFLLCDHPYHRQIVYLSQRNAQTLAKRAESSVSSQVEGEKNHV